MDEVITLAKVHYVANGTCLYNGPEYCTGFCLDEATVSHVIGTTGPGGGAS